MTANADIHDIQTRIHDIQKSRFKATSYTSKKKKGLKFKINKIRKEVEYE